MVNCIVLGNRDLDEAADTSCHDCPSLRLGFMGNTNGVSL